MQTNIKQEGLIRSMIITTAVAGLVFNVYPFLKREKAKALRISCVSNEKQLGIAFRGFGIANGGSPMSATNTIATPAPPTP